MNSTIKNYYLFADTSTSGDSEIDSAVYRRACVSYARIVRSRGQRLIVQADEAAMIAVLFAAAEHHETETVESPEPSAEQLLQIRRPFESYDESAEASWFLNDIPTEPEDNEDFRTAFGYLADWANATVTEQEREGRSISPFATAELGTQFDRYPPELVVILGSGENLRNVADQALELGLSTQAKFFWDGKTELPSAENIFRLDDVIVGAASDYRWHPPNLQERFNLELAQELIESAEKEARLHIALELMVDGREQAR